MKSNMRMFRRRLRCDENLSLDKNVQVELLGCSGREWELEEVPTTRTRYLANTMVSISKSLTAFFLVGAKGLSIKMLSHSHTRHYRL